MSALILTRTLVTAAGEAKLAQPNKRIPTQVEVDGDQLPIRGLIKPERSQAQQPAADRLPIPHAHTYQ